MRTGEYTEYVPVLPQIIMDMRVLTVTSYRLGMADSLCPASITIGISTSFHLVRPLPDTTKQD